MRTTLALLAFAVLLPADSFAQDHFQDDTRYEGCLDPDLFDYSDYPRDIRRNNSTLYERPASSLRTNPRFYGYLPPSSHPNVQWFMRLRNGTQYTVTPHIALFNDAGELVQEARIGVESYTVRGINSASMRNLTSGQGHKEHDAFVSHLPEPGPNQLLWARVQVPRSVDTDLFLRILSGDGKGFLSPIRPIGNSSHVRDSLSNINPASNHIAVGIVRLVNPANGLLKFTIEGWDDTNARSNVSGAVGEGTMTCEIDACSALTLTAQQLERGTDACSGNFGDGSGKWQIVGHNPRQPVWAPSGFIHYSGGVRNSALGLYSDYQGVYSAY
ncbi:MAG: hypothetical protein OXJ53_18905 [Gammaproteobacteria bacterium]|nr:hypothetical protein [Gammaproteobacteria bacterium]MDE0273111.1 hypothetical protein [Gammaproteobacteria bacterium]